MVDPSQDYVLISGYENSTHTVLRFRRKLDTCDTSYDVPITVSYITTQKQHGIFSNMAVHGTRKNPFASHLNSLSIAKQTAARRLSEGTCSGLILEYFKECRRRRLSSLFLECMLVGSKRKIRATGSVDDDDDVWKIQTRFCANVHTHKTRVHLRHASRTSIIRTL